MSQQHNELPRIPPANRPPGPRLSPYGDADDELRLTRRLFLQHSALSTAASLTAYSIAMKTDALAQDVPMVAPFNGPGTGMPYPYHNG